MSGYIGHTVAFRAPKPENKNFYTGGFGKIKSLCHISEHTKEEPYYVLDVEKPKYWSETNNIIHIHESQIKRILV
jgi:hypothetical protein